MNVHLTEIILVDEFDQEIGKGEKLLVHQKGWLHRAFSVLIFNKDNQLLIHQRTRHKYHSGGLWTNTCCGHPNTGESIDEAAFRRLGEEMGFRTELTFLDKFQYRTDFPNGLIEHEIDHVFVGYYDAKFEVNPEEVLDFKWVDMDKLLEDVANYPENYTFWFKKILNLDSFQAFISAWKVLA